MLTVSDEQLEKIAMLVGAESADDEQLEFRVVTLVQDPMLAKRLISWLPEAFGIVLIPHIDSVILPKTFRAKNKRGEWVEIDLDAEPIFRPAVQLATHMYHNGPRSIFSNIATRSAIVDAVNRALNEVGSIQGATLSGPALVGIPAEIYLSEPQSIWEKLSKSISAL